MADEKFDEKDKEKRDEKSPEEKSWEEKWQRDPVSSVAWAVILIWAGLVFLAENLGWLNRLPARASDMPWGRFMGMLDAWGIILIGAGVIVLITVAVRLLIPEYRRPVSGSIFLGLILIGLGLGNLFNWNIFLPMILIALGISFLVRGVFGVR